MKEFINEHRRIVNFILILIVGLYLCIPLFNRDLNVYVDDGIQHIGRAYGTGEALKTTFLGNIIPSFSNGYGYSWNLFYGPLTTYGIMLIGVLVKNYVIAYKVFAFIILIASGLAMHKFLYTYSKNADTAVLGAIIYMAFPYHMTDLYIRNALGEYISFLFIPMVFTGLYNLFYTDNKTHYLSIGAIGLILSHNLSTLMVAAFSIFYCVFNIEKFKDKTKIKKLLLNIAATLLITAFFWMPFLETKYSIDYQVYQDGMMGTIESLKEAGLQIKQLFVTRADAYVFELGIHIWIMFSLVIMGFNLIRSDLKENYVFFVVSAVLSLWLSTKYFPWGLMPKEVSYIQFPWRFMMMAAFFISCVAAMNMSLVIKEFRFIDVIILSVITVGYITAFYPYIDYSQDLKNIQDFDLGFVSGREVEVVAGGGKSEYLPVKAYENRFYIATREPGAFVTEGKALIEDEVKDGSNFKFKIETYDEDAIIELPFIYYPGYRVTIDGIRIRYYQNENGFMKIGITKNQKGTIEVTYPGTNVMRKSALLSAVSLIGFSVYLWKKRKPEELEK